jgi:hypothetical protein
MGHDPLRPVRQPRISSERDSLKLLHELQVHQTELAQQNEELKAARADLEASAERYFGLYESAPVGLVTLNRQGLILEVNQRGRELLGTPGDGLVGVHLLDRLSDTDRAELELVLAAPASVPAPGAHVQIISPSAGGRVLRAEMRSHPAREECLLVALTDITSQQQAQAELARTREILELSNRVARIGYWQLDLDAQSSSWSAMAREIFELPHDHEPNARELLDCCRDNDSRARLRAAQRDAVEHGRVFDLELPITTHAGRNRWVRVTGYADPTGGGARRLLGTVQDIDAHIAADAARLAQARAEMANLSKNAFLARMSHDLRTPLNAVIGFAELLALNDAVSESPAIAAQVQHIRQAGQHLLAMIDEVLDLTSIESGNLQIEMKPVQAGELLRECLTLVEPLARARAISLPKPPTQERPPVMCDANRLRQVLVNLLSNAIKYNKVGGSVQVALLDRGDRVGIEVRDTGTGLSSEQLSQLFQPFNRLGADHRGIEGTGLGLVIAKQLVEAMNGSIDAESTVGVGSVFTVNLRRTGAARSIQNAPARPEAAATSARTPTQPFVVLYVEDNPVNVELMRATMALRPHVRLDIATDGCEGLDAARLTRPDLVLLDMGLPVLDGPAVLARMRADPDLACMPCVAVSANAMPSDIRQALDAGFDDYIVKPFAVDVLLKMLDRFVAASLARHPLD